MIRIGGTRDGRRLTGFIEADGQGELGLRAVRILEADHRAQRAGRRDRAGEEDAEARIEIGPADDRRDAGRQSVERCRSFHELGHGRSPAEAGPGAARPAAASYTGPPAVRGRPTAPSSAAGERPRPATPDVLDRAA